MLSRFVRTISVFVIALLVLAAAPALAQENRHTIRINAGYFVPTDDIDIRDTEPGDDEPDPEVSQNNEFRNTYGAKLAYEFRFAERIGAEIGAGYFRPKIRAPFFGYEDRIRVIPIHAALLFHLGLSDRFDFYFGPQAVYMSYGEINVRPADDTQVWELENEFTWGGKVGIDIPFGETFTLNIAAEYIAADAKLDSPVTDYEIRPRPLVVSAGASFRF